MGVLLAFIVTAWVIYMIIKKHKPQAVLMIAGLVLMFCTAAFNLGTILSAKQSTGLVWFDSFELVKNIMSSRSASLGLTIMSIAGFARYMEHVGASKALFALLARPLKLIRSPYVLLSFSFIVTQVMIIFLPSAAGLSMLLMVTMYPLLIRSGVTPLSALGVIACCQFIEMGPGSGNAILAATTAGMDVSTYFVKYQLTIAIPTIIVVAITHGFVQRWWDKREGLSADSSCTNVQVDDDRPPLIYAVLPVFPLVLILAFSPLLKSPIRMDVITAMLISTLLSMLFEYVRTKNAQTVLDSFQLFFDGMGRQFAIVVSLIICGETFANGLIKIGAVDSMIAAAQSAGLGLLSMVTIMCILVSGSALLMGSSNAAFFSFAALAPKVAAHLNAETIFLTLPMQVMGGMGRSASPLQAATIAIAAIAGVSPFQVAKRACIPMAVAFIVGMTTNFIMYIKL